MPVDSMFISVSKPKTERERERERERVRVCVCGSEKQRTSNVCKKGGKGDVGKDLEVGNIPFCGKKMKSLKV